MCRRRPGMERKLERRMGNGTLLRITTTINGGVLKFAPEIHTYMYYWFTYMLKILEGCGQKMNLLR
jgi:hypothetical protein